MGKDKSYKIRKGQVKARKKWGMNPCTRVHHVETKYNRARNKKEARDEATDA